MMLALVDKTLPRKKWKTPPPRWDEMTRLRTLSGVSHWIGWDGIIIAPGSRTRRVRRDSPSRRAFCVQPAKF
jgi:hypothetical protein